MFLEGEMQAREYVDLLEEFIIAVIEDHRSEDVGTYLVKDKIKDDLVKLIKNTTLVGKLRR